MPRELATLTWSAAAVGVPAVDDPTWVPRAEFPSPTFRRFAPPLPPSATEASPAAVAPSTEGPCAPPSAVPIVTSWAPPVESPSSASARSGWTWTPIMAAGTSAAPLADEVAHDDVVDLAIRLDTFEALIAEHTGDARRLAESPPPPLAVVAPAVEPIADDRLESMPPPPPPAPAIDAPAGTSIRLPSVSFEPATGTVSAERVGGDIAIVTAEVPVFASYAPAGDLVLPDAPVMAPPEVEVREAVMALPAPRPRPVRGVRTYLVGLLVAGLAVAGAYVGLREYIYGGEVAQDGPRTVEVEPARPVVVPAP